MPNTKTITVHWLSATLPSRISAKAIFQDLLSAGVESFYQRSSGKDGYRTTFTNKDKSILVFTDGGHAGMGHHFRLTGKACERYGEGLYELGSKVLENGGHITRLDLAIDDYGGLLDLDQMEEAIRQGLFTSRFRSPPRIESGIDPKTGQGVGKCIRFGRRTSEVFLRVYDKAAEQGEDFHWIRFEIELKGEKATEAMRLIVAGESIGEVALGLASNYLAFRKKTNDPNRSRWPLAVWWQQFLGGVKKMRLGIPRPDNRNDNYDWFLEKYPRVLAGVVDRYGPEVLVQMVERGRQSMKGKLLARATPS